MVGWERQNSEPRDWGDDDGWGGPAPELVLVSPSRNELDSESTRLMLEAARLTWIRAGSLRTRAGQDVYESESGSSALGGWGV